MLLKGPPGNGRIRLRCVDSGPVQLMPGTSSLSSVLSISTALSEGLGIWPPANTLSGDLDAVNAASCAGTGPEKSGGWERGTAGSAVQTRMSEQESGETSLAKVAPLNRRATWKRLADKSPPRRRSWTGTWSGGRATPESCGPNTPTCQQRFGWKWPWPLSISSACPWLLSYWWFTMFSSGHRIHKTTPPAPRYPTAPSTHRGSGDMHTHTHERWLTVPDMKFQQGKDGRGRLNRVLDCGPGLHAGCNTCASWPEGGFSLIHNPERKLLLPPHITW